MGDVEAEWFTRIGRLSDDGRNRLASQCMNSPSHRRRWLSPLRALQLEQSTHG
jgi:hypothetical protein